MAEDSKKGVISAWNEGDYKNLRLHRAQNIINIGSMAPFEKLSLYDINMYGYEFWLQGINALFREGKAKYSDKEREEARELKKECEKSINEAKFLFKINNTQNKGVKITKDWDSVKEKLEEYEDKIYFCNEAHGLSTRNVDDEEDW